MPTLQKLELEGCKGRIVVPKQPSLPFWSILETGMLGAFLHLLLVCTIFFVYIVYTLFVRVPSDCSKPPRSCSFPS
jgi:hypothetical protein